MNKTNSVIEVNGNRYDANSGKMLRPSTARLHTSTKTMIDGFVLGSHHAKRHVKKAVSSVPAKKAKVSSGEVHGRPQRSRTLMRKIVKRPAPAPKQNSQHPLKAASHHISPSKQFRAKTAVKHPHVNRFGYFAETPQPRPVLKTKQHGHPAKSEVLPPMPALPSMVTSASHRQLEKMLDEGLASANAHRQMMNRQRHGSAFGRLARTPRWLKFAVVAVFVSVAALFLIWQNLPAVAVHVAAARAHVNAAIPNYTPEGFAYSRQLKYAPGAVTMEYKDVKHEQGSFSLTQTASNLNSQSLQDSALPKNDSVQTSEVKGTTVYIYGHSNAVWVNRNVLYKLENKADLSSDQVLKIVQSL